MIPQDQTALNYERGRRAGGNAERDSVRVHGGQYIDSTGVLVGCPNEYLTDESPRRQDSRLPRTPRDFLTKARTNSIEFGVERRVSCQTNVRNGRFK